MDQGWDNGGMPAPKKGMPTWAKVLLGCGIGFLLLVGSCVGVGVWGLNKVTTMGKARWPAYVQTVKALQEPSSTQALYEANPGLKDRFETLEKFEAQVALWRPKLVLPPAEMPPLMSGQAMAFEGNDNGERTSVAGFKMGTTGMLLVMWRNDTIVSIEMNAHGDFKPGRRGPSGSVSTP